MKRLMIQLGSVLSLLALAACGGAGTPLWSSSAVDTIDLPTPAQLARSTSFTEPGLMREGSAFDPVLPLDNTTAVGTDASFTPTGSGKAASELAYCVYSFDVDGYDRDLSLRFTWTVAPANNTAWVALANFATNRWEWARVPIAGTFGFTDLAAHTSPAPASTLYAAVLITGSTGATLDRVRIGAQPVTGPPTADLQADVPGSAPPVLVTFDASASTADAPATIVQYEFDFDDGAGFEDFGATATANHTYTADGIYHPQVRVTDVFGGQDTAEVTLIFSTPPPYDEVEPNDTFPVEANILPAFRVVDWSGNCGVGGSYDGDVDDYAGFMASPGDRISAELVSDFDTGNLDLELRDSAGDMLALSNNPTDREFFVYDIGPGDTAPFYLHIMGTSGQSDYLLTVQRNPPTPSLIASPPSGNVPLVSILDASASADLPPGTIVSYAFDPEGDGTYLPPQAQATYQHQYDSSGSYSPSVRVTDNDGNVMTAGTDVNAFGGAYDEVEDDVTGFNDDPGHANPLPAFPFSGWLGSNGQNLPDYPGFDGDTTDYVEFSMTAGQTANIQLTYMVDGGKMGMQIFDNNGTIVAPMVSDDDLDGVLDISYLGGSAPGDDGSPYRLSVFSFWGHYGDYFLQGILN